MKIMMAGNIIAAVTYAPIYMAMKAYSDPLNISMLILLVFIQVLYVTMVYGPIAAYLVELFPAKIRLPDCGGVDDLLRGLLLPERNPPCQDLGGSRGDGEDGSRAGRELDASWRQSSHAVTTGKQRAPLNLWIDDEIPGGETLQAIRSGIERLIASQANHLREHFADRRSQHHPMAAVPHRQKKPRILGVRA